VLLDDRRDTGSARGARNTAKRFRRDAVQHWAGAAVVTNQFADGGSCEKTITTQKGFDTDVVLKRVNDVSYALGKKRLPRIAMGAIRLKSPNFCEDCVGAGSIVGRKLFTKHSPFSSLWLVVE
jgi:hypothetical protein